MMCEASGPDRHTENHENTPHVLKTTHINAVTLATLLVLWEVILYSNSISARPDGAASTSSTREAEAGDHEVQGQLTWSISKIQAC